ncbi:MAG: site-specific DNA-methyltransferase [Proteobacteria bacterium]|nr:site-specific DNA-methyltransferase [Pseudomonadota bacterium]
MEKLKLEMWPVARLRPYERRLRKNEKNVERMVCCIEEYGFRMPILALASGEVVDGDLRLKAALQMGLESVPVILAEGMSDEQVRAFRIMANSSVAWSKWNDEELARELRELWAADFSLELTGLPLSEIEDLLETFGEADAGADPDAMPVPGPCVSRPGDLWQLGVHRLLCGDSTSAADVRRLMDVEQADMIWTDPPYNVDYHGKAGSIQNDSLPDAEFRRFLRDAFAAMFGVLRKGGAAYVAHADTEGLNFRGAFCEVGFKLASCLVWRKDHFVLGRADYQCQHEPILYGWKPGAAHRWFGGRKRKTLQELGGLGHVSVSPDGSVSLFLDDRALRITGQDLAVEDLETTLAFEEKPRSSELHPTMKPVALVERFLKNSSLKGDCVLDPFGGSGTTLIACERTRRRCRTMELDPKYADVIVRRWQEFAGQDVVHATSGETFAQREAVNG